ncbi:Hypothetical predicted protein [Mytilus galloprovincialis]|uniref:Integrase catalytic domain-containing protein n=1 Tax=Mytilus galloprovincialis TaxID=29158 RepID=A0A8B6C114_MYTGA|nr:Hypothetical predicted protein [Mytilus galloprovincialis]
MSIKDWNNTRLYQNKTTHLVLTLQYAEMHTKLHECIHEITKFLIQINSDEGVCTPQLASTINRVKHGKTIFFYNKFVDGVHASESLKVKWCAILQKCIDANTPLFLQSNDRNVDVPMERAINMNSELHSDQGRQFESRLFQSICKFLEIDKTRTTPGHPRSAGTEERSNRTIKDMISKFVRTDQKDLDRWIDFVAMAYYSTHQSTAISAFRLIFGEEMRMLLDVILAEELNENELVSEHDHVMKIQDKLKTAHGIARVSLGTETKR